MVSAYDIDGLLEQATNALRQGDKVRAVDSFRQAADLLIEAGDADNAIRVLFSAATLAGTSNDHTLAETILRHAQSLCAQEEVAYLEPQILFHLAQALLAQGRNPEAIDLFTRILPLEGQFGAHLYAPEARAELKKLGIEPPA